MRFLYRNRFLGANMSITSLNIASSSLQAYSKALDISGNNIANASTNGFQAKQAQFQEQNTGGVSVSISNQSQSLNKTAEETNTTLSSTDLAKELVQSLEYKSGFLISAKLIEATNERIGTLIDISE